MGDGSLVAIVLCQEEEADQTHHHCHHPHLMSLRSLILDLPLFSHHQKSLVPKGDNVAKPR
jgi:hypothetical protein